MECARQQRGFTIVEVLIVLAVTGAMFLFAFAAINGKQNETEFQQSINDIRSSIQQTIDQVAAGDYVNPNNFTCTATPTGPVLGPAGGQNTGCVFLGKVLQFHVQGTNPQAYASYIIVGLQNNTGTLASAYPTALAPSPTHLNYPDASVTNALHDDLRVVSMKYGGTNVGEVGFIGSLGQYSGGSLVSGAQDISVVPIHPSALNATPPNAVDAINKHLASSPQDPSGGVQICFASGGTVQSGLITIGSNGKGLSVTLQIMGTTNCT